MLNNKYLCDYVIHWLWLWKHCDLKIWTKARATYYWHHSMQAKSPWSPWPRTKVCVCLQQTHLSFSCQGYNTLQSIVHYCTWKPSCANITQFNPLHYIALALTHIIDWWDSIAVIGKQNQSTIIIVFGHWLCLTPTMVVNISFGKYEQ